MIMRQNKFLIIIIILLLLINAGTLGFLFFNMNKPPQRPPQNEKGAGGHFPPPISIRLREPLKLTDAQALIIDSVHREHFTEMTVLSKDFNTALGNYFSLLVVENYTQQQKDSLLNIILNIHAQKVSSAFSNFENMEKYFTPEQRKKFKEMLPEIMRPVIEGGDRQQQPGMPPPGERPENPDDLPR